MSNLDIVRAWKDPEYRSSLSVMPPHPAGLIELADPGLEGSAAGGQVRFITTNHCGPTHGCTHGGPRC